MFYNMEIFRLKQTDKDDKEKFKQKIQKMCSENGKKKIRKASVKLIRYCLSKE